MMADAFPWDQPSFRFPRRRTALRNFFPGWPVSSREIKSDSNGCLLPLPSLFYPLFTVALIFCARGYTNAPPLCAKRADTMNERDVRLTRCVSSRFSFAGICLLSAPVCLLLLCRPTFCLAFTFDSSTFRLDFHRLRSSVPVASAVEVSEARITVGQVHRIR